MKNNIDVIIKELIINYPKLKVCEGDIIKSFYLLRDCFANDGKLMICGNGGSAADSDHMVGELMKGFRLERKLNQSEKDKLDKKFPDNSEYFFRHLQKALPAISLVSQSALMLAYINDVAPDMVFAQQVYGYGSDKDVLFAFSTSGNSINIVNAIKVATSFGIKTISLTGKNGGLMSELCNICIKAPASETYRVQEYHQPIYHALCAMLELNFFE